MSENTPSNKKNTRQSGMATKPAFPDLQEKHGTIEKLHAKLKELNRASLEVLILNGVFPEARSGLRHCVYCHRMFNTSNNRLELSCKVAHFREMELFNPCNFGGLEFFLCCSKTMDNGDTWGDELRAEEQEPWCYEGRHWEREITSDDERKYGEEALGSVNDDSDKELRAWWREWREYGNGCGKMGCGVKVEE